MSFEAGNELWRIRATHGRDAIMESPNKLWDAAREYFEWCVDNPIKVKDWVGKDAIEVMRETTPPFTIKEFAVFVGASESWWRNFKNTKTVKDNPEFLTVISRVEDIMFSQKFRGAAVGLYKENLISRELGLRDKMDHTTDGEPIQPKRTVIKWGDREIQV